MAILRVADTLNCSLTIMTLILKKPVIVHYFMVTRKKRIYYKTSLFGKFYLFPQNIVALQNKIIWTSRTKNKGPFYFRLNAKLIFAINNIWELIVGNAFVRSSPQWSWLKYSVIAPEYIILTWSLVRALLMINTVFDIIVCLVPKYLCKYFYWFSRLRIGIISDLKTGNIGETVATTTFQEVW